MSTPPDHWPVNTENVPVYPPKHVENVQRFSDLRDYVSRVPQLAKLISALDAIPNEADRALDYDAWRNVMFAVHNETGGSDEGLQIAHEFSARSGKYEPEFLDERVWPYIRDNREGRTITVQTIYALARKHGWVEHSAEHLAGAFDYETPTPQQAKGKPGIDIRQIALYTQMLPVRWIVRDVLPDADLVMIYGASGSGKSFFVIDLLMAIARGEPWNGKRVKQRRVLYIAAEGAADVGNRLRAYAEYHGVNLADIDFYATSSRVNLFKADEVVALHRACVDAGGGFGVIVVDTLAASTVGADENTGKDMNVVLENCKQLGDATDATVCVIHHSGKDASRGARGFSGMLAAVDAEIEITREADQGEAREARVSKLKGGSDGAVFPFTLNLVQLGVDDDGEPVTSCVPIFKGALTRAQKAVQPRGKHEVIVMGLVHQLLGLAGVGPAVGEVLDAYLGAVAKDEIAGRDTRKQTCIRAMKTLVERGALREVGGRLTPAQNADDPNEDLA